VESPITLGESIMIKTRRVVTLSVATAGLAVVAACSRSGAHGSGGSTPAPPNTGKAVSAHSSPLGPILVDGQGRTVYVFANDNTNVSTCTGACAADWPPVPAPSSLPCALPGVSAALGTTTRSDGSHQLTVAGHPVYRFAGDTSPGQTKGQGITLNGGLWTVVSPSGSPDTKPAAATPTSRSGY
jgi:predicted lipoprotein with Yx(FWY)xxD motif